MIRVTLTSRKEKKPTVVDTERITSKIPNKPRVNLEPVKSEGGRRGNRRGIVLESTEIEEEDTPDRVKSRGMLRAHCTKEDRTPSSSCPIDPLPRVNEM